MPVIIRFAANAFCRSGTRPIGWTWESLMERVATLHYRAAIVGPQGAGKTTLLEDLLPRFAECAFTPRFLRLDRASPRFSGSLIKDLAAAIGPGDIVLLDGCEQLSPRGWRAFLRITRQAKGLIVTSHHPGRLPTLLECRTSVALLRGIIAQLAGDDSANQVDCRSLLARHNGNIRQSLRELYDSCAADELFCNLTTLAFRSKTSA